MENQDLEHIQQVIGYRFQNCDLLQQAFVRRSYSEENGGENILPDIAKSIQEKMASENIAKDDEIWYNKHVKTRKDLKL